MIAREPLKRDPNAGRKPERAVLRNPGARGGRVPVIAILAPALERRTVGLRELLSGESLLETTVSISGRLHVSASEGVRAAVLGGMGVAIVSQWMFAPELACGEVRAVLDEWTLPAIDLWVVFPTGRMVSAKARAFAALVENTLKQAIIPARNNAYEIGPAAGTRGRRLACASAVMALHAQRRSTPSLKSRENSDASKIPAQVSLMRDRRFGARLGKGGQNEDTPIVARCWAVCRLVSAGSRVSVPERNGQDRHGAGDGLAERGAAQSGQAAAGRR
jgi:hypothetical protein